ncbi:MAG: hypothetical protein KOO60_07335 [Gemmatimonadales bacterium]|nr:hypothetical protein [Gemmatimonadales bacterium]
MTDKEFKEEMIDAVEAACFDVTCILCVLSIIAVAVLCMAIHKSHHPAEAVGISTRGVEIKPGDIANGELITKDTWIGVRSLRFNNACYPNQTGCPGEDNE